MQVIVNISLNEGVLDPQGQAMARSLNDLGFQEAAKSGLANELFEVDETDEARPHQRVAKMCETLLSNTVIEDYDIDIPEGQ